MRMSEIGKGEWIGEEEAARLASEAATAERLGRLTDRQLEVLHAKRLFHLYVPREYGGLGLDLEEALPLQERLAYLDGSVGWTVTLCSGASWFVGFMEPGVLPRLFADPAVCFGGSGMDTGVAEVLQDGSYRIHGRWKYATGAPHNTVFTANCRLVQAGEELVNADGSPRVRSFWFWRDEVEVVEDWSVMGLRATASHDFVVEDLHVPAERSFCLTPEGLRREEAVYQVPFESFAEATLASTYLGMFKRFLDLARMRVDAEEALGVLAAVEGDFKRALGAGRGIGDAARSLVKTGLATVAGVYPLLGMAAADPGGEVNRVWRDIFTASQHVMFR